MLLPYEFSFYCKERLLWLYLTHVKILFVEILCSDLFMIKKVTKVCVVSVLFNVVADGIQVKCF